MLLNNDLTKMDFNLSEVMHGHINDKVNCLVAEQWQTGYDVKHIRNNIYAGTCASVLFGALGLVTSVATVYVVASMKDEQERHNRRIEERLGLD